jgi:tRNA dimethylallyltransferase
MMKIEPVSAIVLCVLFVLVTSVPSFAQRRPGDFRREGNLKVGDPAPDFNLKGLHGEGKAIFVVGGTGLYIKALCDGLFPGPGKNPEIRRLLENECKEKGLESLRRRLETVDPVYARKIGPNDKIRTIRALEIYSSTRKPISEHFLNTRSFVDSFNLTLIGLQLDRLVLYKRIEERVDMMYEKGLIAEVENLLARGIREDSPPFRALGYKYVIRTLKKLIPLEEAMALTKIDTRHYAKRQMTWFRKMKDVHWFSPDDFPSILAFVEDRLR